MTSSLVSATIFLAFIAGSWWGCDSQECGVQYLVTIPKVLLAGTDEAVCVNLLGSSSIAFNLTVIEDDYVYYGQEASNDTVVLGQYNFVMNSEKECFKFLVPSLVGETRQRVKLVFEALDPAQPEAGFVCNSSKNALISADTLDTLIQTDKPIYKPGQTVKFRMMSIDKDFKPDTATIPLIWIESPSRIRLAQWEDVEPNQGLVDLEFPMTSEPLLGDWTIYADFGERKAEAKFTVDEYVLPKFEITVESSKPYIFQMDTTANMRVCAKYTYGQPVRGEVTAVVFVTSYRNERLPALYLGETDTDGCFSFDVDLTLFELRSTRFSIWNSRLTVNATVTDSVTEEFLKHSQDIGKISTDALSLAFNVPSNFKPGVPFYGTITVDYPDGSPAEGEFIMLNVEAATQNRRDSGNIFSQNFTSPASGIIEFQIPDIDIETSSLSLYAEAPGYEDAGDANYTQYRIYNPSVSSYLQAQYSPSGSFLQIEPITDKLAPGSAQKLKIFFTSDDQDATENTDFNFVFMSLGDVLQDVPVSTVRRRRATEAEDISVPAQCSGDLEFNECGSACPLVCGEEGPEFCTKNCVAGCFCPSGLYMVSRNDTACVSADNCTTADNDTLITIDLIYPYPPIVVYPEEDVNITEPGQLQSMERSFEVTADMSPVTSLLVFYIRPDGEVVADSLTFEVEESFANQVNLEFSSPEVKPDGATNLEVTSDPNSLCALGIVDKSVYVLGGDNTISKDEIFQSVREYQLDRYGLFYDSSNKCPSSYRIYYRRRRSSIYPGYGGSSSFTDSSQAFKDVGLLYLTNLDVENKPCQQSFPYLARGDEVDVPVAVALDYGRGGVGVPETSQTLVRNYFPETFLWDLVTTDESGSAQVPLQAPHTITDWVASGFCLSPEGGLGVAEATSLRTFQPFFLAYSLPYSVVRGENVPIKVSVFNYLDACLVVRLTLADSADFDLPSGEFSQEVCVCGGEAAPVEFRIVPNVIGQMPLQVDGVSVSDTATLCGNQILSDQTGAEDAIRQELLVKAEGVPQDFSFSDYFCLADYRFNSYQSRTSVRVPQTAVPGSVTGKIIVTGDMLGPSVENLEHLIRLPTGCGEQNMLGFVPNIVALEYLTATDQLTSDLEDKLKNNMRVGYQRELNYRHPDGSYSAFGESDESGNTWLTAFVVRSLAQAQKFIFVDEADLNVSMAWLKELQDPSTGCVRSVGHLGYKAMKGGVNSASMLTAYVVVTFLEAGLPPTDAGVVKGLECVTRDLDTVEDNYALAQMAYALALAGNTTQSAQILEKLADASENSGLTYIPNNRPPPIDRSYSYYAASSDSIAIEINSYIVLTYFVSEPAGDARRNTADMVRWLIKNRGVQGGFASTQDTVMGLTALGKFAVSGDAFTNLYVDTRSFYSRSRPAVHRFWMTEVNRQIQQEYVYEDGVPDMVTFRSLGQGCALVQVVVMYNVNPSEDPEPAFDLKSSALQLASKKGGCYDYRVSIAVSYMGSDGESNMALVTVVPPSGFYAVKTSLKEAVEANPNIKRYEIDGDTINIYFDSLDSSTEEFSFDLTKEFEVEDVKPGYVTITDYYEKSLTESVPLLLVCDPDADPIPEFVFDVPDEDLVQVLPTGVIEPLVFILPQTPPPPIILNNVPADIVDVVPALPTGRVFEVTGVVQDPEEEQDSNDGGPGFGGFGRRDGPKDEEENKPIDVVEDKPFPKKEKEEISEPASKGESPPLKQGGGSVIDEESQKGGDGEAPPDKPDKVDEKDGPEPQEEEEEEPGKEAGEDSEEDKEESPDKKDGDEDHEKDDDSESEEEVEATEVAYVTEVEGTETITVLEFDDSSEEEDEEDEEEEEDEEDEEEDEEEATPETGTDAVQVPIEVVVDEVEYITEAITVRGTEASNDGVEEPLEVTDAPQSDFDQCSVENICPGEGSRCVNFPGTYECQCIEGYTMDEQGDCHSCAFCEDDLPEDAQERFCNADFVYIVKRRRNDLRLLKEKRFDNEVVSGRKYRDFAISDDSCSCRMLEFNAVDRFILIASASPYGDDTITIDQSATILPFKGHIVDALDEWRLLCPTN